MTGSLDLGLRRDTDQFTLGGFLEDVSHRYGDRCAVRFEGRSISYTELERDARQLARGLIGAGVVKGSRVALWMGNRPEWISAAFAVALVGGVLVPVNTFATSEERDTILRHSDCCVLLMQRSLLKHSYLEDLLRDHRDLFEGTQGRLRCLVLPQIRSVFCLGLDALCGGVQPWEDLLALGEDVSDELVRATATEVTPSDDALIIYTSGTTSQPKGILHRHRAPVIQSYRFAEYMGLTCDDRVWTAQPFFWTAGIAMSLGPTLASGACLILQETFEPGLALALLEGERATTAHAWIHQEKAMAEHPTAALKDLRSLRRIEFTSPLAPLAGIEKDEWGTHGSYGLSEPFTIASALPWNAPPELREATSGKALPGMTLRIVDPETREVLPAQAKGEIAVKGVTTMRGYYKVEPELYLDESGFFHTQDGGFVDADGYLHWSGRLSNLIKTGGANVSPLEIEAVLAGHPGLKLALAVGVPHKTLGEAIVLCAVRSSGSEVSESDISGILRSKLAVYKIPKRVLFFSDEDLHYTGNQKIQLRLLREAALHRLVAEQAEIEGQRYLSA